MLVELRTQSFRKHANRTFNFEQGVVALRGANEDGKTTMLEAISYALGGATMLRESLDDVVTWGQKVSSLKVWLTFQVNGVIYSITRSKAGAEIATESRIEATGQTEVTRYVETLLGCSVKTATQLMLANQGKLRGTLEEDGAAVKLIEQLADFQLIDRIIALVQKHLPCGTTVTQEARLQMLQTQLLQPLVDETGPARLAHEQAVHHMDQIGETYHVKKSVYDALQQPARDAQQRLDRAEETRRQETLAQGRLSSAKVTFDAITPVPGPSDEHVATLRRGVEDAGRWQRAVAAHRALLAVPEPVWEGTYEDLVAGHKGYEREALRLTAAINTRRTNIARFGAQKITQTTCGLCGKDLSNVPEVVAKNAALDEDIANETRLNAVDEAQLKDICAERESYTDVIRDGAAADRVFQTHAEFITLDRNFTPAKWTWVGPDISKQPDNPTQAYQEALAKQQAYQRDLGRQQEGQRAVDAAQAVFDAAVVAAKVAAGAVGDAQKVLDTTAVATNELYEVESKFREAEQVARDAEHQLNTAQLLHAAKVQARKQLEQQVEDFKKELTEMVFNNELVTTLRKVRPSIVEELWNIVGATVSSIFSEIRGTPSVFLRADDSFTVDGRGIKGLSGSTLDALGLAIRMGLTKTFLQNTRVMVLDEASAACDDDRTVAMAGVVASAGFDQVLWVTHDDAISAFAHQIIQL